MGFDPVANQDNDVEVVEIDIACNSTFSFSLNYPEFPNSCGLVKLTLLVNILDMLIDRRYFPSKQLCHLSLSEPNGLFLKGNLDLCFAIFCVVQKDLALIFRHSELVR